MLEGAITTMAEHLEKAEASRHRTLEQAELARDKAEAASAAKSEFLAMMSHELRTPLNGILGMLELLQEDRLSDRQKDYLATAVGSTEDLLTIISDILDFSRIEQGKLVIEHRPFNLRNLIENCIASFRHEASLKQLELSLHLRGPWPENAQVHGDPARLRQVLACLLDNAIKFTDDGTVLVNAQWTEHGEDSLFLSCEIQDTGSGVPFDRLQDIFNTFEQLDSSASRTHGGTGIGLPLAQRLVELMGGHISVDNSITMGSTFRFVVPLELEPARVARPPSAPAALPPQSQQKVLIVEDNPVNQRVAATQMKRLGFQVQCANNGLEALEAVRQRGIRYAVILMDCQMPFMDGWEATRQIREWERRTGVKPTPIIAMTADALPGTEQSCRDSGMDEYLTKPVRKDMLREMLLRWVKF